MESKSGNVLENTRGCSRGDSLMLTMAYDGSGRRVSKTRYSKACVSDEADGVYAADWERELVTHYTGIGTEVRESYRNNALENAKVVVNMPNGLGRYGVEDAEKPSSGNATFEWYLKNHLGSTMLVYGTQGSSNADVADLGEVKKAYDYRSFGEQIDLIADAGDKVTENFTGKERDDETELNYFGARYLDPMLGLWISVDPKRQFASPYLYVGNGYNPVNAIDPDGNASATVAASGGKSLGPFQTSASVGLTVNFPPENARDFLYLTLSTRNGAGVSVPRPDGKTNSCLRVTVSKDNASEGFSNSAVFSMGGSLGKKIRGQELYAGASVSQDVSNDRTSYSVDLGVNGGAFDAESQVETTYNISIIGFVLDALDTRMQDAINTTYTEDDAD